MASYYLAHYHALADIMPADNRLDNAEIIALIIFWGQSPKQSLPDLMALSCFAAGNYVPKKPTN